MLRARPQRPSERDLAALADGSLAGGRRAHVEALVAASPALQALVDEQRRAVSATRDAAVPAPGRLRARIAHPTRPAPPRRRRVLLPGLAAAGAAAIVVALILATAGSGSPTIAQAADLATRPASMPAPAAHAGDVLPVVHEANLPFPYWEDRFGWRAVGVRRDHLEGRRATTVFYHRGGRRLGYTIVAGAPLAPPRHARVAVRGGTRVATFPANGRVVATWLRRGHTCVLSGAGVSRRVLLRLASWRGGGTIPY
jgi:hypothetical protein